MSSTFQSAFYGSIRIFLHLCLSGLQTADVNITTPLNDRSAQLPSGCLFSNQNQNFVVEHPRSWGPQGESPLALA